MILEQLLGKSQNKKGVQKLVLNVLKKDLSAVEKLLKNGVDPNATWKNGSEKITPMHAATITTFPNDVSVQIVNLLIKFGANPNGLIYLGEDTILSPLVNFVLHRGGGNDGMELYCGLRAAGAQIICEPDCSSTANKCGATLAEYELMERSINNMLQNQKVTDLLESLESEYQKKLLTQAVGNIQSQPQARQSKM